MKRVQAVRVLDRRDSSSQALYASHENALPQLFRAAPTVGVRHRKQRPKIKRYSLESPLQKRVMRAKAGIEEAQQQELPAGINEAIPDSCRRSSNRFDAPS